MNIGIIGTGNIAQKMSQTINCMNDVNLSAVASRDIRKSEEFAKKFSIPKFYGSYEELAKDSSLDLIYIATPHSRHYEDTMLCLKNGRNVLCEKAFTVNEMQAAEVIAFARLHGLFVGEAIWTRFLPMRFLLDEIISSGVIGNISSLSANLGYSIGFIERLIKPELAGGALLDLGVYTINFALMVLENRNVVSNKITNITSKCVKNEYGVDANNSIIVEFEDSTVAILHSNMRSKLDNRGIINGDKGRIEFENVNNCEGISVILNPGVIGNELDTIGKGFNRVVRDNDMGGNTFFFETPKQITGFEYEVQAALDSIRNHEYESWQMPHSETLKVMSIMDSLRDEWSIKYPFEK